MVLRLTAVFALAAISLTACGGADSTPAADTPKNVIFFLGDGYGMVPMTAARIYAAGEDGELTIDTFPETAFIKTYSNDAQVTDSAPSMSAYMTGVKMNNDVIAMSSDTKALDAAGAPYITGADSTCPASGNGTPATTLLELAKAAGRGTGVVTTTRVTHATPAATYAHICHRDGENTIAMQLAPGGAGYNDKLGATGVDVVLGGGWQHFLAQGAALGSTRSDSRDLVAEMRAKGYTYVSDTAALAGVAASTTKLLGLFNKSHMNFDLDRDPAKEPSLAEMTTKAMDVLANNKKGYFLMVEGGRIDQALHPTLARKALQDAKAFDDAIAAAIAKAKLSDPTLANTLIVVTADHDHTMAFNGYGKRGTDPLGLNINYATGAPNTDVNGNNYTTLVFGNGANRPATRSALDAATVTGKDYLQEVAVRRGSAGSETHGGGDVMLFAGGAASKTFKGTIDNTKVFGLVKTAAGY